MSICSDIYISKVKAQKMVRAKLLYKQESLIDAVVASKKNTATKEELMAQQTLLIDQAVSTMKCWELTSELNDGSEDLYFYNINAEDNDDYPDEDDEDDSEGDSTT